MIFGVFCALGLAKLNHSTNEVTVFDQYNSSLPETKLPSLDVDSEEKIWLGGYNGTCSYHKGICETLLLPKTIE
jgi:hypothetical protein